MPKLSKTKIEELATFRYAGRERKLVKERVEQYDAFDFGGDLDEAIDKLSSLKGRGYLPGTLIIDISAYGSYDGGHEVDITIFGERLETDEEFVKRLRISYS